MSAPPRLCDQELRVDQRLALVRQCEYYFSRPNLVGDRFLTSRMDAAGWVDLSVVASFNRMRVFGQVAPDELARALAESAELEVMVLTSSSAAGRSFWAVRSRQMRVRCVPWPPPPPSLPPR